MRALALAAGAAAVLIAVTGCSSDEAADPTAADVAGVGWSPCDDLSTKEVGAIAGQPMKEHTGTDDAPQCTFVPVTKGGPAFDVSYLFFDGGLDTALDAMGTAGDQLEPVDVPGAEAARIAVRERTGGVLVTGFVQTDGLVQSVNLVDLEPYDRDALVEAATELMGALAENAPHS